MYDIFDEIEVESQPKGDIFDEISPPKPAGDIFDEIDLSSEINRDAGRLPDFQATTRGGPQLRNTGPGAARLLGGQVLDGVSRIPEAASEIAPIIASPFEEAYGIGPDQSILGIHPGMVPTGAQATEVTGIPKAITIPASGAVRAGAGLAQFLTSPQGLVELGLASIPGIGMIQRAAWLVHMAEGVGETAGNLTQKVEEAAKNPKDIKTEDLQSMAEDAANTMLMLYGSGKLSSHEFGKLTGIRAPLGRMTETARTRYAKDLADQLQKSPLLAEPPLTTQPIEQATRFPRQRVTTEPFLQPGVRELADAALQEAQSPIVRPDPAIERLRATMTEIQPPGSFAREQFRYPEVPPEVPRASAVPLRTAENIRLAQTEAPPIRVREEVTPESIVEQPINPGGALKDLPPELQARSNAVQDAMRAQLEELRRRGENQTPPGRPTSTAIRDTDTGEIWFGEPLHGLLHSKIPNRKKRKLEAGFADKEGRFISQEQSEKSTGMASGEELFVFSKKELDNAFDSQKEVTAYDSDLTPEQRTARIAEIEENQKKAKAFKESPEPKTEAVAEQSAASNVPARTRESVLESARQIFPFGETAKVRPTEDLQSTDVMRALQDANLSVSESLKIVNGERSFPNKNEFEKGVDSKYWGDGATTSDQVWNKLRTIGITANQFSKVMPKAEDFTSGKKYFEAVKAVEKRAAEAGAGELAALIKSGNLSSKKPPASNLPTRVKLSGSPQTYTTVERLTPTEIEISNGEKPIRIKNERTGKEEIVLESELQEVKAKTEGAAPRRTKADLNKALREAGLDPSVFPDATSKKSALARVIGKLEEAQTKLRGSRATLSMGVPKAILDLALETAIITLKAGKTIGEALDAAIKKVRYNAKGINEAEVRSHLENILTREAESKTYPVEGESVKMRQSAERATTSEMIPKPVQERIAEAPESFYRQQSMKRVEDAVSTMTDAELGTVPRDSNIYTAAKLEQANRLFKEGKNDAGYEVFAELEKEGTRLGQLINQFKLLKGSRPENIVQIINGELKSKGKDPLTEPQRKAATDLATKAKDSDVALEKATDAWLKEPTDANAAAAEKSLIESNEAALNLQRFTLKYQPKSTPSVLKSILQGNLLTPISEVANIFGNLSFLPFRAANRSIAAGLDVVDSFIRQRPREVSTRPIKGTIEAVKGVGRGLRQIPDVFMHGSGNVIKGETRAGLHPVQAWINQFSKTPNMATTGGRLTINDRVNLLLEGTFGVPAETLLRGLGAGDQPFRQAAQARVIANEARLRGIPDSQLSMARKFPELFFDEAAMKRIQDETLYAIFQRESQTLNFVTKWLRGKGDVVDFLAATVAPYKLTPWNIIGETMSYNPVVALARTTYDAGKGNSRSAKLNAGKLFVGSALTAAGWWLYSKGILAPSLDERDEAQKARLLSNEVIPPNHINLSGLKRALAGEDPTFKAGDETVDVMRAGGLAGSIFYMTANIGRDFEKKPDVGGEELWLSILKQSTLEQARFGLNQSFLNGVDGILTAVKDGNADTYLRQWMNTVASIPLPNSMATLSRATREYKPDFTANTLDQLKNVVKNRLGFAGLDDYLPLKRDFWGEPLRETPEGRNAIFYQFFDISKNKQVTDDPLKLELYRLWRKTGSSEVIPPLPGKSVTVDKQTYLLNADQHSRFAQLVGQQRKRIAEAMAVNPEFYKMGDEQKIHYLKRAYDKGSDIGRGLFWKEYGSQLTPKKTKAGFEGLK